MSTLPLSGITVLELTHTIMGPSCGLVLGDLGANVIKIEPVEGDRTRRLAGFAAGFFSYFNRNKRSLALDLKSPEGIAVLRRLIDRADVLVENFAPGTMERLGLGWDTVSGWNQRLIYCSLKGFLSGPYENRPALDEIVQYMTGLAYMTGPPGRPLRAGSSVVDIMGGTFGAVAILAALRQRDVTGRGEVVKSSLFEACAYLMAQHMTGEVVTGQQAPPMPARVSAWSIYDTFETADRQMIFVGITSDAQWKRFCQAFGHAELLSDPTLATNELRVAARDRVKPVVAAMVARHSLADLLALFEKESIPCSPVMRPSQLFTDPQLNAGDRMLKTRMPDGQVAPLPPLPMEIGGATLGLYQQPPKAGEHSSTILAEAGFTGAEIEELKKAGTIPDGAA